MPLDALIEAILFFKNEPVTMADLVSLTGQKEPAVREGITTLRAALTGRGLTLIEEGEAVMLGTNKEATALIEKIRKEELSRDLGKAGLETLTIVLYQGPLSRADIDYIRGVNSSFILRALLIRGLVERVANPTDSRGFLYQPSFDLLAHLGVSRREDLPEFASVREQLTNFAEAATNQSNEATP